MERLPRESGFKRLDRQPDCVPGTSRQCDRDALGRNHKKMFTGSVRSDLTTSPEEKNVFWEQETLDFDKPHNYALVIQLEVDGAHMSNILVDTRYSIDTLSYETFKNMGYPTPG